MLKRKTKIRKRLARIVLAALLCTGGMHGLAAPSVAEAATVITVSNITGDAATGDITVTADPAGSMVGQYISEAGVFRVRPDAALAGISEINITGSTIPAYCMGSNSDSADASGRTVTVSGADTILGGVYANAQNEKNAAEANNNTLIIEDARITGIDSDRPAQVYAGASEKVGASGNLVEIRNAKVGQEEISIGVVAAGVADNGNATGNQVTVEGEAARIYGVVVGGLAGDGNATGNQVDISNGEVVFTPVTDAVSTGEEPAGDDVGKVFTVAGGLAQNGEAAGNRVNISGGTVGVKDGQDGPVIGGYAFRTASGNTVTVKGGTILSGAYGGVSVAGAATGNVLNIEGGTVYGGVNWRDDAPGYDSVNLAGGFATKGVASENTVTVNGGEFTGGEGTLTAVAGGFSQDSDAVKNKVVVNGGTNLHDVYGGASENGNAENNEVYINTGANVSAAIGGTTDNGSATGNIVTVSGGTLDRENGITQTFGGYAGSYSDNGAAGAVTVNNNTVTVSGGTFGPDADVTFISGGDAESYSDNGAAGAVMAINNTVTVSGGTFGGDNGYTELLGGYAWSYSDNGTAGAATANNNTVTVSGGTFGRDNSYTEIYGGYAESNATNGTAGAATANNNTVTISGNPVFKGKVAIMGGEAYCETTEAYSETTEEACNNTVTILTPVTVYGLWGGLVWHDGTSTGNTLNIAAKNVTITEQGFFQNMNFYLPADIANGDTMLTIKGLKDEETGEISGNKLTGVTFGVAAQTGANLAVGDTVNLVVGEQGLVTDDTLKTTTSMTVPKDISTDTNYELSISKKDANTIMAAVTGRKISPNDARSKSPAETRMAVATQVNAGADLLAGQGLSNAADAAAAEQAGKDGAAAQRAGGYAPFAAVGVSSLRAQSGSHVDTKGIGLALGFARELQNKSGKLLVGPVLEYGYGRYDSYQDDNSKADGKSHYWGVGIIAKQTNDNGLYYEGSLRVGRASSDYNRNNGDRMNYDSDATYWGAHLGIGKVQDIGHNNTLDYYGKYFYSHTGGDTTTMHTTLFGDVETRFDSVDSHRLRVGARVIHAVNEKNKIYGGLAYQYEFSGDARVTYNGVGNAPSPSVKGSSGMLELGWQVKPGRSPMVIDLNVTGWAGKQRGITANLQANWTF